MPMIRHFSGNRDTDSARLYLSCAAEGLREIFRSGPARRAQYRCDLRNKPPNQFEKPVRRSTTIVERVGGGSAALNMGLGELRQ